MLLEKKVILCADDFGISPGINKSICMLAELKKVSATSVMVVYENWDLYHRSLLDYKAHLDIGLHFILTEAPPLSPAKKIPSLTGKDGNFFKMSHFIKRAWLGLINGNEVLAELTAQYNKFVEYFGIEPDFIDGHHNVHQYPVVEDEVIQFIKLLRHLFLYLKVNQVVKFIILSLGVLIPVTTPTNIQTLLFRHSENKTAKVMKPIAVAPINRIGSHINSNRGKLIMFTIWVLNLTLAVVIGFILSFLSPVPLDNGTIEMLNYLVKKLLQSLVARLYPVYGTTPKTRH